MTMMTRKSLEVILIVAAALVSYQNVAVAGDPVTGGCVGGALGPAHDVAGALCEDFDTDRNASGSFEWTRRFLAACPVDPLLGVSDLSDDVLGHSADGGAIPLGVDGRICSEDMPYAAALLTCHVVPTENDWHLHSPFEGCDPTYDPRPEFASACAPEPRAHSGFRSMHMGRHLNAWDTLYDTYRFRQTSAFVMDRVALGSASELDFWHIIQVCDDKCVNAGPGGTTAGGQVHISLLDDASTTFEPWQRLTPTANGYNSVDQSIIVICEFDPGDDQFVPDDETMCGGEPQWSDIGDIYGTDRTCLVDTDGNDPVDKDCGETTTRTVVMCDWVTDPACGSFLENGSVGRGVWARSTFDLSSFAGREARLRWIFEGGGGWSFGQSRSWLEPQTGSPYFIYAQDDGWYVDDIRLTDLTEIENGLPPVADAGPDQSLECTDPAGGIVATLDGSASFDPEGQPLAFSWAGPFPEGGGQTMGVNPTVTLPLGHSAITLIVSDCRANSEPDTVEVNFAIRPEGLQSPLAALVPEGEPVPMPEVAFKQGGTLPLKLHLFCGAAAMTGSEVAPPEIVDLQRTGEPLGLETLDLDAGQANDNGLLFRSVSGGNWVYNLSTRDLTAGTFEITILMPDDRRFVAGFVLR
jgi:hypothetical protein